MIKCSFNVPLDKITQKAMIFDEGGKKASIFDEGAKKAGIFDEAKIKQQLDKYETEDSNLSVYFKIFYWAISNYFRAQIASNLNALSSFQQKNAGKSEKVEADAMEVIESAITFVFEVVKEKKTESKTEAFTKILLSKLSHEDEIRA